MKTKKFLFYLLAALLGGCVPVMSLHPLYTEKDLVFEEKLLGTWGDDPNDPEITWDFQRSDMSKKGAEKTYNLTLTLIAKEDNEEDKKAGSFDVHLVKLKDRFFLDIYPNKFPCEEQDWEKMEWPYNAFFAVSVHTFIKVDSFEPHLRMRLTDDEDMNKLLEENPGAVEHASIEDTLVLTASTKELQAFVLKYADDSRLFTKETVLSRKKAKAPTDPNKTDPNCIDPNEQQ